MNTKYNYNNKYNMRLMYSAFMREAKWNNLSTDCVDASRVDVFKNKIDRYLIRVGYI